MKRKDEAEERKQTEKEQQKSVERTHWTLNDETPTESQINRPKFIVEYDHTGGVSSATGRQSFQNYNKPTEIKEPENKITKLTENRKK